MDVSNILAAHDAKFQAVSVEKETPLDVDTGLLTVTDSNPIDGESYKDNLEEHLQSLARDGAQALLPNFLLQRPLLPRAKPLPKPKPQTKWEQFAAAKGIQHKVRDKREWDEEKQAWVNRWGRDGKNKQLETQWITEVPMNAEVDHDPRKVARDERKARVAKNEKQRLGNVARASNPRDERKQDIERTLASSRISTASMGKFDKKLDGEKKTRGVKRKFDPAESQNEKNASLALLNKMESDSKKSRREPVAEESVLNVRKAVRFASKGRGGAALGREAARSSTGSRGGARGRGRGGSRGRGGKR
ncbi:ribosome biogenesis regulatory protein-domain-containing protein [Mycena floridula]|nr:ribosome biogenesis regulatory protein-domain-containing protein [Mycena floridula]